MKHVFILSRSEPDGFDYLRKPITRTVEMVCYSNVKKATRQLLSMLDKFPAYVPRPLHDPAYLRYKLSKGEAYVLESGIENNGLFCYYRVSIVKEAVL